MSSLGLALCKHLCLLLGPSGSSGYKENSAISTDSWPVEVIQICCAGATAPAVPALCREQRWLEPESSSSTSLLCCGSSCSSASRDRSLGPAVPSKPLPRLRKPWLPILSHRRGWRRELRCEARDMYGKPVW